MTKSPLAGFGCLVLIVGVSILVTSLKTVDDLMLFCFGKSVPVTVTRWSPGQQDRGVGPQVRFHGAVAGRAFEGYATVSEAEYQRYGKATQARAIVWKSSRDPCLGGRMAVLSRALGSLWQAAGFVLMGGALTALALALVLFWLWVVPDRIKKQSGGS